MRSLEDLWQEMTADQKKEYFNNNIKTFDSLMKRTISDHQASNQILDIETDEEKQFNIDHLNSLAKKGELIMFGSAVSLKSHPTKLVLVPHSG